MRCPKCGDYRTLVVNCRSRKTTEAIYRVRECQACGYRFTTYENTAENYTKMDKAYRELNKIKAILERSRYDEK